MAQPVRLRLQRPVLHHRHASAHRVAHASLALLHHMRQLVAEQLPALHGVRLEAPGREIDVGAHGERDRADPLRLRADMHPHGGEIRPQRRLHLAAHAIRKGSPATTCQPEPRRIDLERVPPATRLRHWWARREGGGRWTWHARAWRAWP